ncbi:sushi, von Willebrand factor type A, EGF and pentraxin domain-containing protein 1-like [Oncorhynchus nerka]|uniref:sushi, von Willebrand factor type A, EGF and pentraxin domain-containing protein 1-like n=1 Tax=Oncorhynchus nerka TaxID=8023 RepID=UPI0031B8A03E
MQPSNVCWSLTIWMAQLALTVLTVQAKNCTKPIGGENMVLSDAFITQETFVDGAKVTFQCAIGYASTGWSPPVTCTAGVWSEVKLKCERKSCGSPGEVTNGQFNLSEGVLFGDQVVATCNTGYVLVGSGVRTCMAGGWDGRVPVCEVVKCGKPPNIVNGGPVVPPDDTYDYGSVVQYDCEKDYTLVGTKSITCSENGEFQPAPPECKMVSCPNPVVENGVRIDGRPPYTYLSFVTYRCNAGYEMEGQASLTCEIEGWSAPYPTCKAKNCTKPIGGANMVLSDAFITQETFVDGANVTFQCAIGYASTGRSPPVTCTAGVWSEVKLKCERKSCGSPGEVTNGQFNISEGVLFGDQVVATCNTGYVLVGSGVRTCMDGGWDGRVPVCEVVKCGKPPNIVNGGPVVPPDDTYDYGSVVQYDCEKNYTLVGAKSITCSENGEFQPAPPECKMVSCPNPVVENGVRIDGRPPYTYMSFVTYRCNAGYEMEGQASLTCEIEGWSAPYPTCKGKTDFTVCYLTQFSIYFSSDILHHLVFMTGIPMCQQTVFGRAAAFKMRDSNPEAYKEYRYVLRRTIKQAKRQYRAKIESYYTVSDARRMWQGLQTITGYEGKYSHELPNDASLPDELNHFYARFGASNTEACMRASAVPDNCVITHSVTDVVRVGSNTSAMLILNTGAPQSLNNDETAYREVVRDLAGWCQNNNLSFNVTKTKEMIVDYRKRSTGHAPILFDGAAVEQVESFKDPSHPKYAMQPSNICWSLTIWMVQLALIVLTVQAKTCTKPIGGPNMVLSDAFITQETFVDGAKVTFQCAIGYASTGWSPPVTCTAGVWSEVKLKCERKSCGSPGEVTNGQFNLSEGVLFGDQVVATCNTGYVLVGSGVRTCMAGGWDGRVPVCEVVKCGKPPNIVNGGPVVPPDDTYDYGSVVQYDCEKDYTLVGTKSITCSENGEFQPAPPECKMVSCPNPVVENGVRIDGRPPYTYMSFVTYRCNAGYEMEGKASLTCEIEGWSAPYPTCKALLTTTKPTTTKRTTIQDRVPRPTDLTPKANDNTGVIAGCVVGGLAIICGAVFAVYKVKQSSRSGYSSNVAAKNSEDNEL